MRWFPCAKCRWSVIKIDWKNVYKELEKLTLLESRKNVKQSEAAIAPLLCQRMSSKDNSRSLEFPEPLSASPCHSLVLALVAKFRSDRHDLSRSTNTEHETRETFTKKLRCSLGSRAFGDSPKDVPTHVGLRPLPALGAKMGFRSTPDLMAGPAEDIDLTAGGSEMDSESRTTRSLMETHLHKINNPCNMHYICERGVSWMDGQKRQQGSDRSKKRRVFSTLSMFVQRDCSKRRSCWMTTFLEPYSNRYQMMAL